MQLFGKGKAWNKVGTKGTTMEFFNLKQPRGANKYPQYKAVYSKYTAVYVTTKRAPDTVHSPTPGQLHVESIQLACTCALCCCYALCMKREELCIFYSLWVRCFVVMLQHVGFLGGSQLFGSQVRVGAPTWHLARAKSGFGARQVRFWHAPVTAPFFLFVCTPCPLHPSCIPFAF